MTLPEQCDGWQKLLFWTNVVGYVQVGFGVLSLIACSLVLVVIIGHRKYKKNPYERLILGFFICNLIYSASDCIPIHVYHTHGDHCGNPIMIVVGKKKLHVVAEIFFVFWGFGVFASATYELIMVVVSGMALKFGTVTMSWKYERAGHLTCCLLGLIGAFAGVMGDYDVTVLRNMTATPSERWEDDELRKDDLHYAGFYGSVSVVVGLSLVMWVRLRVLLAVLLRHWRKATVLLETLPGKSKHSTHTSQKLLELQRSGYTEIMKPLERYVVVFTVFLVPMVFGSTYTCTSQSVATWASWTEFPCQNLITTIMSVRSLALAASYFWSAQTRSELSNIGWCCCCCCLRCCQPHYHVRFKPDSDLEAVIIIPRDEQPTSNADSKTAIDGTVEHTDDHDRPNNDLTYELMDDNADSVNI